MERPAKTKLFPAKLRAVLVTFGFSENIRNFSKQHHKDPKFPGNRDFQKSKFFLTTTRAIHSLSPFFNKFRESIAHGR